MRTGYVVIGILWCGILLSAIVGSVSAGGAGAFPFIAAAFLTIGAAGLWRTVTLAVTGDEQALIVRNLLRSQVLPRSEIEGFRLGRWRRVTCVYVLVRGHNEVRLEATTVPSILDVLGSSTDDRFTEHLERLQTWYGSLA
jgi:hypothetical protein